MSEFVWSDAWFLLAVKYVQGDGEYAEWKDVQMAGDFINRTGFMTSEVEHAVKHLGAAGLLEADGDRYKLGPNFAEFWESSGAGKRHRIYLHLDLLVKALGIEQT